MGRSRNGSKLRTAAGNSALGALLPAVIGLVSRVVTTQELLFPKTIAIRAAQIIVLEADPETEPQFNL